MMKIHKSYTTQDCSSFSCLPDEIVSEVVNKLTDLKTLCICKLVSRRFHQIVLEVKAISFNVFLINPPPNLDRTSTTQPFLPPVISNPLNFNWTTYNNRRYLSILFPLLIYVFAQKSVHLEMNSSAYDIAESLECKYFQSAITSMRKFRLAKSLCIQLPSPRHEVGVDHNSLLFKWKVKFSNKVDSIVFLSPNSVCDMKGLNNGQKDEGDEEVLSSLKKLEIAYDCWFYALVMFRMLLCCILDFPLLEKVLITDSGKRGKVSVGGSKIGEVRKWLHSPSELYKQMLIQNFEIPDRVSAGYIPLLNLPVSGYVMKGVNLVIIERDGFDIPDGYDRFMKSDDMDDDFQHDKEEAAYAEAVMEIFEKHSGSIESLR